MPTSRQDPKFFRANGEVQRDVYDWLMALRRRGGYWYWGRDYQEICFQRREDLMFFKLSWGGVC
jgi:hypothetical protein